MREFGGITTSNMSSAPPVSCFERRKRNCMAPTWMISTMFRLPSFDTNIVRYNRRGGSTLGHVWTAPWQGLSYVAAALVGCGHVSGLLMRRVWPQAIMLCADRSLYSLRAMLEY